MSDKNKPHLPIGYWIKKADELLAERINEVQRSNGLTWTGWQILNTLSGSESETRKRIIDLEVPKSD